MSSVLPSTGLLGRSSNITGGQVLLRVKNERPCEVRQALSPILAFWGAQAPSSLPCRPHQPPPGSPPCWDLGPWPHAVCFPFCTVACTATTLTSRPVTLENSGWSKFLSSVSYPIFKCFRGISMKMPCQNIENWNQISAPNLVNLPNFSALTNSAHPSCATNLKWFLNILLKPIRHQRTQMFYSRCFSHTFSSLFFWPPTWSWPPSLCLDCCNHLWTTLQQVSFPWPSQLPQVFPHLPSFPVDTYLLQNFQQHVLLTPCCLVVTPFTSVPPTLTEFIF